VVQLSLAAETEDRVRRSIRMTEWLLGTLLVLILIIKVLEYLELFDVLNFLSEVVRLTGALLFGISSLIIWASRKLLGRSGGQTEVV